MSLRNAAVPVALALVVAAPAVALGVASHHPGVTVTAVTVVAGALIVSLRSDDAGRARRELTWLLAAAVLFYGVLVHELLHGVIAACAVYLTGFLTGPDSALRAD